VSLGLTVPRNRGKLSTASLDFVNPHGSKLQKGSAQLRVSSSCSKVLS
jgi:hypothetical protein